MPQSRRASVPAPQQWQAVPVAWQRAAFHRSIDRSVGTGPSYGAWD